MTAAAPIISQTALSMLSAALVLCGEKPLNSLTDPRYGAQVGAALFDMVYENELQINPWRFSCKKQQLSLLNQTPLNEWQYAWQIPTDCLSMIGFWGVGPDKLYEIYGGNVLYTNISSNPTAAGLPPELIAEYQFKPDPSTIPSYFSLLVTLALAQHMCKPVTESDSARTKCEQAYNVQRGRAMFADARQRPNRPLQHRPFIQVR
jgi:hypothetical protein